MEPKLRVRKSQWGRRGAYMISTWFAYSVACIVWLFLDRADRPGDQSGQLICLTMQARHCVHGTAGEQYLDRLVPDSFPFSLPNSSTPYLPLSSSTPPDHPPLPILQRSPHELPLRKAHPPLTRPVLTLRPQPLRQSTCNLLPHLSNIRPQHILLTAILWSFKGLTQGKARVTRRGEVGVEGEVCEDLDGGKELVGRLLTGGW